MPANETQHTTIAVPKDPASIDRTIDGPHVVIDGVALEANRTTLSPAEVARVMRVPESEVRNMLRRGELHDVSCDGRRRLDPDEVIAAVEQRVQDGELEKHVFVELAALIAGRL
ncbi:MAG TPA: helix-turn-helix domain-containing protein [Solirubrobacteraceae bacterium]|nr:helix-turn-helix domain-containing protein [Solirubrobacteraceae bacterium]